MSDEFFSSNMAILTCHYNLREITPTRKILPLSHIYTTLSKTEDRRSVPVQFSGQYNYVVIFGVPIFRIFYCFVFRALKCETFGLGFNVPTTHRPYKHGTPV